ncbi:MAG: DUF2182 domain-containing protein [Casimicrobiaceae bacterium]
MIHRLKMEAGEPTRNLGIGAPAPRDRLILGGTLLAIVALSWGYLVLMDAHMEAMLTHGATMADVSRPWAVRDLAFTLLMWVVMMIGMMAPAAAPVLHLYAKAQAGRGRSPVAATLWFASGYALAWSAFSAVATLAQWLLHLAALLSPTLAASSPLLGGMLLCAAGAYQFTPLKRVCLIHCRSPLGFLLSRWRDGPLGAFGMGLRHGAYCLGCCWALMALLFVAGVMNLLWIAALALLVLVEKAAPRGLVVGRVAGAVMLGVGIGVLLGGW